MAAERLTVTRLIEHAGGLGSLPDVWRRLDEAVENPRSTLAEIAATIEIDPAFCARVLRLSNSAVHALPRRVESVAQAMTVIGLRQVRDLALATTVVELFAGIDCELVDMASFWRHSLATGLIARLLAVRRREINPERFFAAGLMHDLGALLLYLRAPGPAGAALAAHRADRRPLHLVERELLGFDHADVGQALLNRWRLPAALIEATGHHHRREAHGTLAEGAVVHVADVIADAFELGGSGETQVPTLHEGRWRVLGLHADDAIACAREAELQLDETMARMLEPL